MSVPVRYVSVLLKLGLWVYNSSQVFQKAFQSLSSLLAASVNLNTDLKCYLTLLDCTAGRKQLGATLDLAPNCCLPSLDPYNPDCCLPSPDLYILLCVLRTLTAQTR